MVGAIGIIDELETITAVASWLEVCSRSPAEGASIGDLLSDSIEWQDILGGTLQEDDGDSANRGWLPSDGVLDTCGYDLIEAWLGNWVATIGALGGLSITKRVSVCWRRMNLHAKYILV